MKLETKLAQAGNRIDKTTGAISIPIHHSTTYAHPRFTESTGFDYSRMGNPTRQVLEQTIAELEGGTAGFAFASGMAAIHCVCQLFQSGDHLIVSNDLYGGTYRLIEQILRPIGVSATYVNTSDTAQVEAAMSTATKAIFIETPTNPTMQITDIRACVELAQLKGVTVIVDNTFMTPVYQRPLELGADIVVHSATKFLGGHNDVLAGLVVTKDSFLAQRIAFYQNAIGAVLGPQDAWLLLRGMKTLALRMERHEENARALADWLVTHPAITRVYYPGLSTHPGKQVQERQSTGYGGVISFEVADKSMAPHVLDAVRLITFAESLGGVESLITFPAVQTHADIPQAVRESIGVTERLLRLSVGIEHIEDLKADLEQALASA
ncbi:trans-sulfuration enzyme family protein [Alicyclobacillus ferrooxydans]|uniref:Cystathionine gamma-synthase n=1 Tax=Alicyclobacillus ferrooxydans TaxID=471514 RepID=A0A0N8PNX6_9BACL|nr:aminotransferase class I/II-fold pyridoxal phosphate-dependent enzyme [Alicyclobacillus ferrooxydans]KPV42749.1 cystathionine gamma-synthase [Alicyclobacillus ferrooxydans]